MTDPLSTISDMFPRQRLLIVGDLVADQYLHGTIARVSREAPVFILRHDQTDTLPGSAANTAVNAASLGAAPILIGVTGRDENGTELLRKLEGSGVDCQYIIAAEGFKTTTKVRVLAGQHYAARQQVIRIDYENQGSIGAADLDQLAANLAAAGPEADAIIVSDYNYGVATAEIFAAAKAIAHARGIPLIVDSRFRLGQFRGATSATPNQEEVEQILGKDFSSADCERLREDLGYESLIVTRGNKGMTLVEAGRAPIEIPAVGSDEPVDVTGAGDTVIAVYSLGLASGLSSEAAARIANHAGSVVVMKKGTASVTRAELAASINDLVSGVAEQQLTA